MNDEFKCSVFNYCVEKANGCVIYNTLYNSLVRLNRHEYLQYAGEVECEPQLQNELLSNGLWVEQDLDEKRNYLAGIKAYTLDMPRPLNITVTTTLKCNARCSYCYERGVIQKDMFENAEEQIVNFIKYKGSASGVHINWFGGEPLMNTKFMDTLSERLDASGISFTSYLITNGSRIDEEILDYKLDLWNVKDVQITLDGTQRIYEQRKNYINQEEGEFYRILSSIRRLAEKQVFVHIRINIEKENKKDVFELVKELNYLFGALDYVVFYPAFITGSAEPLSEEEKVDCVKQMLELVSDTKKLTLGTKLYGYPRVHACMNSDPYSFSIDVNGYIYTCEHDVGKAENSVGQLKCNQEFIDKRGREILLSEECENCVFLPKCMGGCEANRREGDTPCMIEKYMIQAYLQLL